MALTDKLVHGVNRLTRGLPFAGAIKQKIKQEVVADRVFQELDLFVPNSRGTYAQLAEHAWISAGRTVPMLARLAETLDPGCATTIDAAAFCSSSTGRARAAELKARFDAEGSDKGEGHGYHWVYGEIFARLGSVRHLLEIGIGTANTQLVSHMGAAGRPGASLRAFRDALPGATIRGADIDRDILFTEERITTHQVDQRDLDSFASLRRLAAAQPFDVVIDDGLHVPDANLTVLIFALYAVAPSGWFVVEDIKQGSLPLWHAVRVMLARTHRTWLIRADSAWLFLARRAETGEA